jgi:AbrB family looped-hinge helix DNA binding protein
MPKATLTSKGQLTLPKEVRSRLGVAAGDQVEFRIESDGTITVLPAKGAALHLFGLLRNTDAETVTIEDMDRAIADRAAADNERIEKQSR